MAILKVARLGHPVLRMKASPVEPDKIKTPAVQRFIDDMIDTMHEYDGAGLAANQVHTTAQIAVIEVSSNPRYPDAPSIPLTVVINPVVTRSEDGDGGGLYLVARHARARARTLLCGFSAWIARA